MHKKDWRRTGATNIANNSEGQLPEASNYASRDPQDLYGNSFLLDSKDKCIAPEFENQDSALISCPCGRCNSWRM